MSSATALSAAVTPSVPAAGKAFPAPHGPARRPAPGARGPNFLLIDGSNVLRANGGRPRLEVLLAVAARVAESGYDFGCIFDANAGHKLREEQGPEHEQAYRYLLANLGHHFVETTGGTVADEVLLAIAERGNSQIISNDQYRDRSRDYPWVKQPGRIVKVNSFRDLVFVGEHLLEVEPLGAAMAKVERGLGTVWDC